MQATWKVMVVVDLMNLDDQVEKDFMIARRRARLCGLKRRFLGRGARSTLLRPDEIRRSAPLSGATHRGLRTVETSSIVGSVGKHAQFDPCFMPLAKASPEKWKRIDRAFRSGQDLPPVSLLKLGEDHYVIDGHHRVSVARFHGAEWIDAEVTEYRSLPARRRPLNPQPAA